MSTDDDRSPDGSTDGGDFPDPQQAAPAGAGVEAPDEEPPGVSPSGAGDGRAPGERTRPDEE